MMAQRCTCSQVLVWLSLFARAPPAAQSVFLVSSWRTPVFTPVFVFRGLFRDDSLHMSLWLLLLAMVLEDMSYINVHVIAFVAIVMHGSVPHPSVPEARWTYTKHAMTQRLDSASLFSVFVLLFDWRENCHANGNPRYVL